jgi:enhancer of polycomb-like protein
MKKSQAVEAFIEENLEKHKKWNVGWIDKTWRPITPPLEISPPRSDFRQVFTSSQLPTPPASVSDEGVGDAMEVERTDRQLESRNSARIRFGSPPDDVPYPEQSRFRRRIGRGGRMMIDRRGMKRPKLDPVDDRVADRYQFDGESSEDDQVYPVDCYGNLHIRYRIMIERQGEKQQPAAQNRRSIDNHHRSISGHLLPPAVTGANPS